MGRKAKEKLDYINKEQWNELIPAQNGVCPIHGLNYWIGSSNFAPQVIGGQWCPACEFKQFGMYSNMSKEIYADVRYKKDDTIETDNA